MDAADLEGIVFLSTMMARCRIRGSTAATMARSAGGPARIAAASDKDLAELLGGPPEAVLALQRFLCAGKAKKEAQESARRLESLGAGAVWIDAPEFPERLRSIPSPPPFLFVRSRLPRPMEVFARDCVAVIGTRRPSAYGEEAARRIAGDLAREGVLVVSGLARGIDTCAHAGALEAGGCTAAVLANGIDGVYPWENEALAERIAETGAVIGELPPGTPPKATLFPARNRIISGLCDATAVVEAAERSGTMITAGCALDQGRDVFAVPGSIFSERSDGTNGLLKEGAYVLTGAEDILGRLPAARRMERMLSGFRPSSGPDDPGTLPERILRALDALPMDADALARRLGADIGETTSVLALLELRGAVSRERGRYARARAML